MQVAWGSLRPTAMQLIDPVRVDVLAFAGPMCRQVWTIVGPFGVRRTVSRPKGAGRNVCISLPATRVQVGQVSACWQDASFIGLKPIKVAESARVPSLSYKQMKRLSILLAGILLTACQSVPSAPESWEGIYAQAERAYSNADFAESGALADRAAQRARDQWGGASLAHAQAVSLAGAAHLALAQYEASKASFEQALPIILSSSDTSAEDKSAAYNNLAEALREQGRYDLALPLYQQALELVEATYGANSREAADATAALALAYHGQGELDRAEPLYRRALAILDHEGAEDSYLAGLLGNMADVMWRLDHLEEAEALARRALAIETRELGSDHPNVAGSLNTLGVIQDTAKHYDQALDSYERALAIRVASLGPGHPSTATTHSNIAATYEAMKRYNEAEIHFAEAIRIFELTPSRQSDAQANRRALAEMYRATHRLEKAEAVEQLLEKRR